MVLLIGPKTYSSAEDFAATFVPEHHAILVGEPTGGSTGQPMLFPLPGGGIGRICTVDYRLANGNVFVGIGIAPNIMVPRTISDVRSVNDATLERAISILTGGQER